MYKNLFVTIRDSSGKRVRMKYKSELDFIHDFESHSGSISSNQVLLVEWGDCIIFSSLYGKFLTVRSLYEWFKS